MSAQTPRRVEGALALCTLEDHDGGRQGQVRLRDHRREIMTTKIMPTKIMPTKITGGDHEEEQAIVAVFGGQPTAVDACVELRAEGGSDGACWLALLESHEA